MSTRSDVNADETTHPDEALVCLSHLRWDFVFQRPQHLMTRFADERRVYFIEEPVDHDGPVSMQLHDDVSGVRVVTPHLPRDRARDADVEVLGRAIDLLFAQEQIRRYSLWYYTPMALPFTQHLTPRAVAYDCMDELSAFADAPPELVAWEAQLLARADVVFTGGRSLYEAKRGRHPAVHAFPSAVDVAHFGRARDVTDDPSDQRALAHPRIGFFGVIDERFDRALIGDLAARRPDWQIVLIGPVVKIDPATLPQGPNIHYLGPKPYAELPRYLAGWDVAMLPFALNDATRFISPTKTPEYLAAGKPVVSTSIRDVVDPYGARGLAEIADTPADFEAAITRCLRLDTQGPWRLAVREFLSLLSWDRTYRAMRDLLDAQAEPRGAPRPHAPGASAEQSL